VKFGRYEAALADLLAEETSVAPQAGGVVRGGPAVKAARFPRFPPARASLQWVHAPVPGRDLPPRRPGTARQGAAMTVPPVGTASTNRPA